MRTRRVAGLLGSVVAALAPSGCGGPPSAPPSVAAAPSSADRVTDCVLSVLPWLRTYLDGGTDPGDYQEMGLSNAQGGALRELQRQATAVRARGPLPSGWAATEVRRACDSIVAASATPTATTSTRPPGWP
ncbi:hypothetical protein ABT247_04110 [Kitasatospora sp. NPDC001539]|uniref:hypothetical protein n=1 Tax=Kitasatospora sp. NPDC001539 TaxID=3154384 RepID=UPI00332C2E0A